MRVYDFSEYPRRKMAGTYFKDVAFLNRAIKQVRLSVRLGLKTSLKILALVALIPLFCYAQEEKGGAPESAEAEKAGEGTAAEEKLKKTGLPSGEELKEMRRKITEVVPENLGEEGAREFEQFNLMIDYFGKEVFGYRKDIQELIERRYEERKRKISDSYEKAIKELEVEERTRREEAIARFEAFLRRYPNDPIYTPDALFRLSELYFEKSDLESQQAMADYYKELDKFEKGETQVEPTEPRQDFSKMVNIYHTLLNKFPDYRYNDAVTYLLGYCLDKMGEREEARKTFLSLVSNPKFRESRYLPEAWMLLGESYFDEGDTDKIREAIAAYQRVLGDYPDYANFDKVLYKLAWAYYRIDMFPEAVGTFVKLIDLYEQKKKEQESEGKKIEEGVLKPEAIRYIAISYSDENWQGGGVKNAQAYFALIGHRPYERDVFKELGDVYFDQTKYENAVAAYKVILDMDVTHEKNPETQAKVIEALLKLRNFQAAAAEREILVAKYKPGSEWYAANKNNPVAIKTANDLAENSLAEAAFFYHQQAKAYEKDERKADALQAYRMAAINYGKFLERFPHAKDAYEMNYFYADALFFAGDFEGAATEFERVRNSTAGKKYRADAADRAVRAYNQAVLAAIREGKIQEKPLKKFQGNQNDPPVTPTDIPPLLQKLIDAGEKYLELAPEGETAPLAMYVAAEYAYRYDQHQKAREACMRIIKNYPKHDYAKDAANLLLETYLAAKDWDNVQKWAEYKAQQAIGDVGESMKLANSAVFKRAEILDGQGKFEDAAKEYLMVIKRDPKFEYADIALNNAAIDYEKLHKFDTALRLYERIYKEYPQSKLADYALFRVAYNAERSWNFETAIAGYQRLYQNYKDSQYREKALYNAAINLEYIQDYKAAAREYKKFQETFRASELAPSALFDAATVYSKMGDDTSALRTFDQFIKEYQKDPKMGERVIRAHFEMSRIYNKSKDWKVKKKAEDECKIIIEEYRKRGMNFTMNPRASHYAAQCVFEEAMELFKKFEKMPIGSVKPEVLKKQLQEKAEMREEVENAFKKVYLYKAPEWALAAAYKIGHSYQVFAKSLFESPIPKELKYDLDAQDAYRIMLEELAAPIEDKATQLYERAYELCKQFNVINKWVRLIEEALAYYKPAEFPLLKEPVHRRREKMLSAYKFQPIKPGEDGRGATPEEKLKEAGDEALKEEALPSSGDIKPKESGQPSGKIGGRGEK